MARLVYVDCRTCGVSGDMLLGALVDLGADVEGLRRVAEKVCESTPWCDSLELHVSEELRGSLRGVRVEVRCVNTAEEARGSELLEAVRRSAEEVGLKGRAFRVAVEAVETMLKAESRVHGRPPGEVHLHELSSADTVFDIVGVSWCLDRLGLLRDSRIVSSPVAVGGGVVEFSHGRLPTPAPATLEILRMGGIPVLGGPVEAELSTPTGVALLVSMVDAWSPVHPDMKVLGVGYGAGSMEIPGVPNLLRISVGEPLEERLMREPICILETDLDDVDGETLGYVMDRLLEEGARDVKAVPTTSKKGRPGVLLRTLVYAEDADRIVRLIMDETGTLGVRVLRCTRYVLEREVVPVEVEVGGARARVRVKVSRDREGRIVQVKPEYEDLKTLSKRTGIPLRRLRRIVLEEASRVVGGLEEG